MLASIALQTVAFQAGSPPMPEATPVFSIELHDGARLLGSEKDRALARALALLPSRLGDMESELGDTVPLETVQALIESLGRSASLRLAMPADQAVPVIGELRLRQASQEDAHDLAEEILQQLRLEGLVAADAKAGMLAPLTTPFPLWLGHREEDLVLAIGAEAGLPAVEPTSLLRAELQPLLSGGVAYGKLLGLIASALPPDDGQPAMELLAGLGLLELDLRWALGCDQVSQVLAIDMPGWARITRERGIFPQGELEGGFLRAIPADAVFAAASLFDFAAITRQRRYLLELSGPEGARIAQQLEAAGAPLEGFFAALGDQLCFYSSDSTGGAGFLSLVAVIELADAAAFESQMDRWAELGNRTSGEELQGRMRVSSWNHSGARGLRLEFPGLPVPFEPSLAWTQDRAVLALTPQAALAALEQIRSPESSLIESPAFLQQWPEGMEGLAGAVSLNWLNTPRLLRDGYGLTGLLCSMLANGVRSVGEPARDPGLVLPPFWELARDSRALVGVTRLVGDSYRGEIRMDRSQLVNMTGMTGMFVSLYGTMAMTIVGLGMSAVLAVPQLFPEQAQAAAGMGQAPESMPELFVATRSGDVEAIRRLLEGGSDPGQQLPDGLSALHVAAGEGMYEIAGLLIESGADPDARQSAGATPLHIAVDVGNLAIVRLLLENEADVDAQDGRQYTPLMLATLGKRLELVQVLLNAGADVELRSNDGSTALHAAVLVGQREIAALLLAQGAQVDARNLQQYTPLHVAAHGGNRELAELLLAHGADVAATTSEGGTAAQLALFREHEDLARYLEEVQTAASR